MQTHKAKPSYLDVKLSQANTQIFVLMKSRLLNTCSSSTEPNTWIMANFVSFTYYEMLRDRIVKWEMILHILVKRLIVLGGPKAALALLFIIILNMDICIPSVEMHITFQEPHVQQPLFFGGYKRKHSKHLDGCWMTHHIFKTTNSEDTHA
jgi:hypothetical protein